MKAVVDDRRHSPTSRACREHIAYTLPDLAGVESVPYAVQMLLATEQNPEA